MSALKESTSTCFRFDDVVVDCHKFSVVKGHEKKDLTPRAFDVLRYLIEHPERVVEKQELFDQVWKEKFVTDNALTRVVKEIRQVLGDSAESPRYIETVPKRGYRFIAEMNVPEEAAVGYAAGGEAASQTIEENERQEQTVRRGEIENAPQGEEAKLLPNWTKRHRLAPLLILATLCMAIIAVAYIVIPRYFVKRDKAGVSTEGGAGTIRSIAVLPFTNTSGNPDTEYLSEGISESLINSLSELSDMKVIARSSSFRYRGKEVDPQEVGRDLNVRAVLMGRVRQMGDSLNVQVDLVDATTGAQLWGEEYERKVSDVLAVKQAIARDVTQKLRLRLSGEEQRLLVSRDSTNAHAYQLYLRGRFHWNKRTVKELLKAIDYFQQTVAVDPTYALGYAGLADAYTQLSQFSDLRPREVMPKAKDAALKALSLDEDLAEAHAALGLIIILYDYDFAGAERELKRAIELNPNYGTAHHYYGRLLSALGRHEEAFAEINRALEIDPLSLPFNWIYSHALIHARKYDESIAQLNKTQELDATFPGVPFHLARVYQAKGSYAESVEEYAKYLELSGEQEVAASARENFARSGWQGFLRGMVKRPDLPPLDKAYFYAALGEKDKAFGALNRACEERDGLFIMYLKVDPRLDPLRDDPRFRDLMWRVGY